MSERRDERRRGRGSTETRESAVRRESARRLYDYDREELFHGTGTEWYDMSDEEESAGAEVWEDEPWEESGAEEPRTERKRRRKRSAAPLVVFLLVCLLTVVAGGAALWYLQRPERRLPGEWVMTLSLTERAAAEADAWLSAAELGEELSVRDVMGELDVKLRLSLDADGRWSRSVDAASYTAARAQAYEALAAQLRELLLLRTAAVGREAGTAEDAEARITATLGMTTLEYLEHYGPKLLPEEEELRGLYDGSGSYTAEGNVLRRYDGSEEEYLVSDGLLIITGADGTEVYRRAETEGR